MLIKNALAAPTFFFDIMSQILRQRAFALFASLFFFLSNAHASALKNKGLDKAKEKEWAKEHDKGGLLEVFKSFIPNNLRSNPKDKKLDTELLRYAAQGRYYYQDVENYQNVENLLFKGADPNAKNKAGDTPLHLASRSGALKVVVLLLSKKALINAKNKYGVTPLQWACGSNRIRVLRYLVSKGASIDTKDQYGYTPLHDACWNGHLEIVEYLLSKGASINAKEREGRTPLWFAQKYGRKSVVDFLLFGKKPESKKLPEQFYQVDKKIQLQREKFEKMKLEWKKNKNKKLEYKKTIEKVAPGYFLGMVDLLFCKVENPAKLKNGL